ncbi:hypothetical protein EDD85DRAFT_535153 [Armillaria nabsnona]|nr:hypothetical protein EDD85DRAFT_535153 [Armillaria nabsnona]
MVHCGHIFCAECIFDHILASSDGFRPPCPTCRTKFHISVPELRYLPCQYHQFILPSMRRVFLDSSPNPQVEILKAELKDTKSRILSQKKAAQRAIERAFPGYVEAQEAAGC